MISTVRGTVTVDDWVRRALDDWETAKATCALDVLANPPRGRSLARTDLDSAR
jgi:hypothetical protein